jgi:hypothetical protein
LFVSSVCRWVKTVTRKRYSRRPKLCTGLVKDTIRTTLLVNLFVSIRSLVTKIKEICNVNLVLHGILKDTKVISCSFEDFKKICEHFWKSVFDFDRLASKKLTFTLNIETDGLSTSVHFQQPKRKLKQSPICKEVNTTAVDVWVCDPGRTNIFFMVKKTEDNSYDYLRLTRNQYYKDSGITKAKKDSEKWQSHKDIKNADLPSFSPKGVDIKTFELFLDNYMIHWDTLWKEYSSDKWSIQRMRLYEGKKRVFANFFNKMESKSHKKKSVVCYGAAKFNPTAKK